MYDMKGILKAQRTFYQSGRTHSITFRLHQLHKLQQAIQKYEQEILNALYADLNKAPFEAYATEIGLVLGEISHTIKHLQRWVNPVRVRTPLVHFPSASTVYREPYGCVLILSPWNYPFQLTMTPLIGALAAGNCAMVKPSEYSVNTTAVMEKIIKEIYPPHLVFVVRGGREANRTLLDEPFDYIFFTGSVAVGKVVMEAAAKHLTPVTLELGGKSPCIVDETANIKLAAKRIIWGKLLNAGQTCVAPDYLLVHRSVKSALVRYMRHYIIQFYGRQPLQNRDYPKIINQKHFLRLKSLIAGGRVLAGGQSVPESLRIAPTILDQVTWDSPLMQEEIFGPLLPILEFDCLKEVITIINAHPKPLALYLFTTDKWREAAVMRNISFGGGCVNDTVIHVSHHGLPFGGVGASGMGQYHGKASFDTFTHEKSVMEKSNVLDMPFRYPPFTMPLALLKKLMK